jgi:hypothetical protein
MSIIIDGRSHRRVKNLGWLLRNWQLVESFKLDILRGIPELMLTAWLNDGRMYQTEFGSLTLCWRWLDRPVFRKVNAWVNIGKRNRIFTIGDQEWRLVGRAFDSVSSATEYRKTIKEFKRMIK